MSDAFQPIPMQQLSNFIFSEWKQKQTILGIPESLFVSPDAVRPLRTSMFGHPLDTPFGVAAGPHSQMAQNIIAAWLCGARFIELKTIQTLDELDVSKPCIDMEDVGFNCEWSQELKIQQSFDEYLRAWVLIHALHHKLGFTGEIPGVVFNISVGYNLEGMLKDNVQWFLRHMLDAGERLEQHIETVASFYPAVRDIPIGRKLSDSVTLSTMHGCPPDEIGRIGAYLIEEWGFHTFVKCNPTLLGPKKLRGILNDMLGFKEVLVPDEAFEHDLTYPDAIKILTDLQSIANRKQVFFGVKLSNTLECINNRNIFPEKESMMYMSGRPLQGVTVQLAAQLAETFNGNLMMSYAGGADAFNAANLLRCGMVTVTTCSDLLRSGGYMRMAQYVSESMTAMKQADAHTIDEWICSGTESSDPNTAAYVHLLRYAKQVLDEPLLKKDRFERSHTKTTRPLGLFDCVQAPCADTCPIHQDVPLYMEAVAGGDFKRAAEIVLKANALPAILGRSCTHICEPVCVRTHYDEPLAIREIKRFIMDQHQEASFPIHVSPKTAKIGIIGAGPCGFAVAKELGQAGYDITLFEKQPSPGGMVQGTIPGYRATQSAVDADLGRIKALGVQVICNTAVTMQNMKEKGFDYIVIACGAQKGIPLGLKGEHAPNVLDAMDFLRASRENKAPDLGQRVGVIGGGDVAMDCARSAKRLSAGDVTLFYRRTRAQMPAEKEEIEAALSEGIILKELSTPIECIESNKRMTALRCQKMKLGEPDESGRQRPLPLPGSTFDTSLDTLIVAIGQQPDFDFLGETGPACNKKGYIQANPETLETSLSGVYAGGDAINSGPETIVKALGDGKKISQSIRAKVEGIPINEPGPLPEGDYADLLQRRGKRAWRVDIPESTVDQRNGFDEVIHTLSKDAAQKEAARCLACHKMCSICTTVCPNRALFTYSITPEQLPAFDVKINEHRAVAVMRKGYNVFQSFQVAVLTDFCNECANCETFCPTAGAPYRDKPRIYISRAEFEAQENNAFTLGRNTNNGLSLAGRFAGQTHRLVESGDDMIYETAAFRLHITPDGGIQKTEALDVENGIYPGDSFAPLAILLKGLKQSAGWMACGEV